MTSNLSAFLLHSVNQWKDNGATEWVCGRFVWCRFGFISNWRWYVNLLSWAELNWKQNTYILNRDLIRKKHSFNAWVSFQHSVLFRASSKQTLSRRYSIRPHNNRFDNIRDNLAAIFNSCCCLGRNIHFSFWIVIVISFFYSKKKTKQRSRHTTDILIFPYLYSKWIDLPHLNSIIYSDLNFYYSHITCVHDTKSSRRG